MHIQPERISVLDKSHLESILSKRIEMDPENTRVNVLAFNRLYEWDTCDNKEPDYCFFGDDKSVDIPFEIATPINIIIKPQFEASTRHENAVKQLSTVFPKINIFNSQKPHIEVAPPELFFILDCKGSISSGRMIDLPGQEIKVHVTNTDLAYVDRCSEEMYLIEMKPYFNRNRQSLNKKVRRDSNKQISVGKILAQKYGCKVNAAIFYYQMKIDSSFEFTFDMKRPYYPYV